MIVLRVFDIYQLLLFVVVVGLLLPHRTFFFYSSFAFLFYFFLVLIVKRQLSLEMAYKKIIIYVAYIIKMKGRSPYALLARLQSRGMKEKIKLVTS